MYRDNQKVESTPSVTRYFPVRPNSFLCVSLPFSLNLLFSFCYFGGGGGYTAQGWGEKEKDLASAAQDVTDQDSEFWHIVLKTFGVAKDKARLSFTFPGATSRHPLVLLLRLTTSAGGPPPPTATASRRNVPDVDSFLSSGTFPFNISHTYLHAIPRMPLTLAALHLPGSGMRR